MVIVLSHMKVHNELILAKKVPEIDIIMGGHDHIYYRDVVEETGVLIVKSGSDFETFSDIKVFMNVSEDMNKLMKVESQSDKVDIVCLYSKQKKIRYEVIKITIENDKIKADPEIIAHAEEYSQKVATIHNLVCAYTEVDLDARFNIIRV